MLPSEPGQIATVLVALAVTGGSPSQTSAGKESSVPPPATELIPRQEACRRSYHDTGESSISC